jgi:L-amino acid N-acyltransferase YncA
LVARVDRGVALEAVARVALVEEPKAEGVAEAEDSAALGEADRRSQRMVPQCMSFKAIESLSSTRIPLELSLKANCLDPKCLPVVLVASVAAVKAEPVEAAVVEPVVAAAEAEPRSSNLVPRRGRSISTCLFCVTLAMVRPAAEQDLAAINEIENWAVENTFAHFGLSPITLESTTESFAAASGRYPWLVAEESSIVVGFARAGGWKAREAYDRTTEIGVYVLPEWHGRRIATSLYEVLFDRLSAKGFHTVLAGIALPNDASVRLHEAFGMVKVAELPEVGFKHGAWRNTGYWARVL